MKFYISKKILLFPLVVTLLQCASFYQSKQLVYSTRNSAFYKMPKDEIKKQGIDKRKI